MNVLGVERTSLSPRPSEEGKDEFWEILNDIPNAGNDRSQFGQDRGLFMANVTNFAGLLAITVTIFLVGGNQFLPPDMGAETGASAPPRMRTLFAQPMLASNVTPVAPVDVEPSPSTHLGLVVNTVWSLTLVLALLCALLATLSQSWTGNSSKLKGTSASVPLEHRALAKLEGTMATPGSHLDHLENLVVGLLHFAVTVFLVGLALYLFPIQSTPSIVVAALSASAALLYVAYSVVPLFNSNSHIQTPLSHLLRAGANSTMAFLTCIALYVVFAVRAVKSWIRNRRIDLKDVVPLRQILALMRHSGKSARPLLNLIVSLLRDTPGEDPHDLIDRYAAPQSQPFFTGRQLVFIMEWTWLSLLGKPDTLRYMSRRLLNLKSKGVADFFVTLRNDSSTMIGLTVVFCHVESVPSAIGAIRFLQVLLLSNSHVEGFSQFHTNGDWRWKYTEAIFAVLPAFFEHLGVQNDQALSQGDFALLLAVSSFRWGLILAWGDVQGDPRTPQQLGFLARSKLRLLFTMLHSVDSFRMCAVSSSDHDDLDVLFDTSPDPRLELLSRNILTLLRGVHRCGWRNGWQMPDATYLADGVPSIWEWRRILEPAHSPSKPAASECLRDLLGQEGVQACSSAVAVNALCDLKSLVDLRVMSMSVEA